MALYKATIFKEQLLAGFVRGKWSNVYTITAGSLEDAAASMTTCRINEQNVSYDTVHFTHGIVREAVLHGASKQVGFDTNGELVSTGLGGPLPLFCTVRVTFTDNLKKPEQKYLRLGANEANLSVGRWDGEFVSYVAANYAQIMIDLPTFVGPGGEHPTDYEVHAEVQNRQLGWHRRTRPGFRRGWVPV
jgi:hypothetical protein